MEYEEIVEVVARAFEADGAVIALGGGYAFVSAGYDRALDRSYSDKSGVGSGGPSSWS